MPYLDVPPAQIYYEDHTGPDNAETLVFLHGAAGNHISWWQQIPYFSKTYRCLTIDHRGFGWSADPESLGGNRFVEDLSAESPKEINHCFIRCRRNEPLTS